MGDVFLGADLGATWLRVAAVDERGRLVRRARIPAVAPASLPGALGALARGWGCRVRAVAAGSTRLGRASDRRRVAAALRRVAPRVRVLTDLELAWRAALGGKPGILLLAGTGSVAYGKDARGREGRAGGLGPLLGDDGSAFWLGREWLRLRPQREALSYAHRPDPVRAVAALAPRVLEASSGRGPGAAAARRIIASAQEALALQARAVGSLLRFVGPAPLTWHGGLMLDDRFRRGVLRRLGRGFAPVAPRPEPPELAAARLAALR